MRQPSDHDILPRVVKLETGLDTLARELRDLTEIVREQTTAVEGQIQKLTAAVQDARAPHKTEWTTIIGFAGLILTIGAVVFVPFNWRLNDLVKTDLKAERKMEDHEKLQLHPVGKAIVDELGERILSLDAKLQKETALMNAQVEAKVQALDLRLQREFTLETDRIASRLTKLETFDRDTVKADNDELRQWRLRAMTKDSK